MGRKKNPNMTTISKDVAVLQNDMGWVKLKLDSVDKRTWVIVTGIIISIILTLANILGGG